jgi:hypothetical protein
MKVLFLSDVEKKLKELNPDIIIHDNSSRQLDYWTGNENRTGIYLFDRFLAVIDRGEILDHMVQLPVLVREAVTVDEGQSNPKDALTVQEWYSEDNPFCGMLNQLMKNRIEMVVPLGPGGQECHLQRKKDIGKHWICIRFYFRERVRGSRIVKLGWRKTFKDLIGQNVNGITKETLEKAFDISLDESRSEESVVLT